MTGTTQAARIVIVVHNLPVPYDRRVWLEATTLASAGHDVTVVCPATEAFPTRRESLEGVQIRRFPLRVGETRFALALEFIAGFLRVAGILATLGVRRRIDILHVCNPPEIYWPLALLLRLRGTRFVFDHHDLSPEMYRAKFGKDPDAVHRVLLWLERRTYRAAHHVIVTNESYRSIGCERNGVPPERTTVVRSGPSLERFELLDPDVSVRNGEDFAVVFLGEIGEQDGVETLIETLGHLRERDRRAHLMVIGDGPALPQVKQHAKALGVDQHCTFYGRVSDDRRLSELLSSADIGAVPDPNTDWSRNSTMNKVMEYMYFGLPIAAFDLTETRVSAEGAALYAEPDNAGDLATKIEDIVDDQVLAKRMAEIGMSRVRDELAWEHSRAPLLAAYDAVVRPSAVPSRLG